LFSTRFDFSGLRENIARQKKKKKKKPHMRMLVEKLERLAERQTDGQTEPAGDCG